MITHYSQYDYERFKLPGQEGFPTRDKFGSDKAHEEAVTNYKRLMRRTKSPAVARLNGFYAAIIAALALISVVMSVAVPSTGKTNLSPQGQLDTGRLSETAGLTLKN